MIIKHFSNPVEAACKTSYFTNCSKAARVLNNSTEEDVSKVRDFNADNKQYILMSSNFFLLHRNG